MATTTTQDEQEVMATNHSELQSTAGTREN
jgi:hypothetical protein